MRPLIYNLAVLLLFSFGAKGSEIIPKKEFDKIIEKEFPIDASGTVDLLNKFGAIDISESSDNKVSIVVSISVKASSQSRADDVFERIDVKFRNDSKFVQAHTEIGEGKSSWISWGNNSDFQINYEVKMPTSCHLKLTNKYGNAYIPDLTNGAEVEVKYGKVKMGSVKGDTRLTLGYSDAEFHDVEDLSIAMKYSDVKGRSAHKTNIASKFSELELESAKNVRSESKYDEFKLGKIEDFKNTGKYDDFKIEEARNVNIDSKYSGINLGLVHEDLGVTQGFGHIMVDELGCGEGEVNISVDHTDVQIGLSNCSNYSVFYNGKYTGVNLPRDLENQVNRDGNYSSLDTSVGNGGKKMKFQFKYGSLKITE